MICSTPACSRSQVGLVEDMKEASHKWIETVGNVNTETGLCVVSMPFTWSSPSFPTK